ncbi:uncharacterized protein [Asterias amurensis]
MDSIFSSYLGGFCGFSRSFNRSVLAHDHRLHQDYRKALNNGSLPCNRLRIITIGDKGVGKSSTLHYLQGDVCDPQAAPQATEGIEITICETSDRDPTWKLCDEGVCTSADDPGLNAAWCVCKRIDSLGGTLHKDYPTTVDSKLLSFQSKIKRKETKNCTSPCLTHEKVFKAILQLSLCMVYQIKLSAPAVLLFILSPFINDGYGVVCWLSVFASVPVFKGDFNSSYRFITSVGLQIIAIDVAVTAKENVSLVVDSAQVVTPCWWWDVLAFVCLAPGLCVLSLLFGLLCGTGCRSGLAIAFCLTTHQSVVHKHTKAAVAIGIGNLIGLLMLRGGLNINPSQKNIRMYSLILFTLLTFMCLFIQPHQLFTYYVSDVIIGMFMGIGNVHGVLKGRKIVAKRKLKLPYHVKKTFGFAVGITLGHLLGWRLVIINGDVLSIVGSVLAALGFLFYDFLVAKKVWHLENNQGIPISTIRHFLMDSANKDNPVTIKLHFWDNAGDSVYQTMQQFFRPAEAVYLLVFSLKTAMENEDWQLDRLRQWLFTLKAHSKNPTTLIFIVGTHRDSVTKEFVDSFSTRVDGQLYNDFCGILAINGDKGPVYIVENSKPMDEHGMILRQAILNTAKTTPLMNELFPIRYLSILNKIKELQSDEWIMTTSDLLDEIAEDGMTLTDLQKVLAGLNRTGDVIYREDDEILKEYVVINPQNLLDVLKTVVCIPPKASRNLIEADDWSVLENEGVASLRLIKSVVGSDSLLHCVIRLMKAYDLVIPVPYSGIETDYSQQASDGDFLSTRGESTTTPELSDYFIVPSYLPEFNGDNEDFWEPSQQDEEYVFDFGYVSADSIFHRLLAKCWCDRDTGEVVYNTRGRFRYQQANFYTMRLQKMSLSQNTIQVTILHDRHNCCSLKILRYIRQHLEEIRKMDFPKLPYTCGPVCRVCSKEDRLRVLKVCGDDKEFPTANMQYETFMDLGKYHKVHLTPQLRVNCGRRCSSPELSPSLSTSRTSGDVPPLNPSISVGETANRVTVITAGDNAKFDIHGITHQDGKP